MKKVLILASMFLTLFFGGASYYLKDCIRYHFFNQNILYSVSGTSWAGINVQSCPLMYAISTNPKVIELSSEFLKECEYFISGTMESFINSEKKHTECVKSLISKERGAIELNSTSGTWGQPSTIGYYLDESHDDRFYISILAYGRFKFMSFDDLEYVAMVKPKNLDIIKTLQSCNQNSQKCTINFKGFLGEDEYLGKTTFINLKPFVLEI